MSGRLPTDPTARLPPEVKLCIISWIPGIIDSKLSLAQAEESNSYLDDLVIPASTSDKTCRSLSGTNRSWRVVANEYLYETVNLYWVETGAGASTAPLLDRLEAVYRQIAIPYGRLVKHLVLPLLHHDDEYLDILEDKSKILAKITECFVNLKRLHIVLSPLLSDDVPEPHLIWHPCINALRQLQPLDYFGIASAYMHPISWEYDTLNSLVEAGVFNAKHVQMSSIILNETAGGPFENNFLPSLISNCKLNIVVPSGFEQETLRLPPNCTHAFLTYRRLRLDYLFAEINLVSLQRIEHLRIKQEAAYPRMPVAEDLKLSSDIIEWINLVDLTLEGITIVSSMSGIFRNAPKLRRLTLISTRWAMLDIRDLTATLQQDGGFSAPVTQITIHDYGDRTQIALVSWKLYEESGELEFERVCARRKIAKQRYQGTKCVPVGRQGESEKYLLIRPLTVRR